MTRFQRRIILCLILTVFTLCGVDVYLLAQHNTPSALANETDPATLNEQAQTDQSQEAASQTEEGLPLPEAEDGTFSSAARQSGPSLRKLLEKASEPVGEALYVWGGGWNEEDTGAGDETRRLGISSNWQDFMNQMDGSYDFRSYPYLIHDGLDCSGFVGWTLYNAIENSDGQEGYVTHSSLTGDALAARGWGEVIPAAYIQDYRPGDILYSSGHVFIALGQYEDGSLLFVHSAPPSGVQISGTCDSAGNLNSMAAVKAAEMMQQMAPEKWHSFAPAAIDWTYLSEYDQFRWNDSLFPDSSEIQSMGPDEAAALLIHHKELVQEQAQDQSVRESADDSATQ